MSCSSVTVITAACLPCLIASMAIAVARCVLPVPARPERIRFLPSLAAFTAIAFATISSGVSVPHSNAANVCLVWCCVSPHFFIIRSTSAFSFGVLECLHLTQPPQPTIICLRPPHPSFNIAVGLGCVLLAPSGSEQCSGSSQ